MKKTIGVYLSVLTAILVLADFVIYKGVLYTDGKVNILLMFVFVMTALSIVISLAKGAAKYLNIVPVCCAILLGIALAVGTGPMVREVAFVIAQLNPFSTIQRFVVYLVVTGIAWILSIIVSFIGLAKVRDDV